MDKIKKPDWVITARPYNKKKIKTSYVFETKGFAKYGFGGEVLVMGEEKNGERIAELINSFCMLLINGEKFDSTHTHQIDYTDGRQPIKFNLFVFNNPTDGIKYQLAPLMSRS